jgi:uncharacterized protein
MDVFTAAVLVAIGIAAGLIASIVGGAAVIVYPAMIAVGIPPQPAAVANIVAIMPGTMLAALSDRSQLPKFNRDFIHLIIASIGGAVVGALLLLLTPERTFNVIIPLLLGFATLLRAVAAMTSRSMSPASRSCCRSLFMADISGPASGCSCSA